MAGRLLDIDPEEAFQHALAASRRGGRLAAVREAVGVTAYAAGHYGEALREFRTFRRISGSNVHLPVMADCERGLGRPDRALDLARSEEAEGLDAAGRAELAMVVSGARADLGQLDAAVSALEVPQLDLHRAFAYSPRLFRAYADALDAVGRSPESGTWRRQADVADRALGLDDEEEPDIIDLGDEDDSPVEPGARPRVADLVQGRAHGSSTGRGTDQATDDDRGETVFGGETDDGGRTVAEVDQAEGSAASDAAVAAPSDADAPAPSVAPAESVASDADPAAENDPVIPFEPALPPDVVGPTADSVFEGARAVEAADPLDDEVTDNVDVDVAAEGTPDTDVTPNASAEPSRGGTASPRAASLNLQTEALFSMDGADDDPMTDGGGTVTGAGGEPGRSRTRTASASRTPSFEPPAGQDVVDE